MQQALSETKGEVRILSSNISDPKIWEKIKGIEKDFNDLQIRFNENFSQNKNLKQSVNEVWKLIDNPDRLSMANCWERYEILNKNQEKIKSNKQFELVISPDSITKRMVPENIIKCNKSETLNYSPSGAKVKGIYNKKKKQCKAKHADTQVNYILVHICTNPKESPKSTTKRICKLLFYITEEIP